MVNPSFVKIIEDGTPLGHIGDPEEFEGKTPGVCLMDWSD